MGLLLSGPLQPLGSDATVEHLHVAAADLGNGQAPSTQPLGLFHQALNPDMVICAPLRHQHCSLAAVRDDGFRVTSLNAVLKAVMASLNEADDI